MRGKCKERKDGRGWEREKRQFFVDRRIKVGEIE